MSNCRTAGTACRSSTTWAWSLILGAATVVTPQARSMGTRDASAISDMAALAAGRNGVVVWQSRRAGPMRIYACDLDGSDLRQLSPDVAGKDHLAPLISPDGTRVLYYQPILPMSDATYYADHIGDMMIIGVDGAGGRRLLQEVRTYFECRFARWLDNDRVAYIGEDHDTYLLTVSSGATERLFAYPYDEFGAIPNRQLTHAVDGMNRVFEINSPGPTGTLTERQDYDGCEGNMSWDGDWAYRVKGGYPGHDFVRMRLGNYGQEQMFFANENDALPSDQNYIYFPQLSLDQRWLSLGVSCCRAAHSHWTSDYDIFVVPIDPGTFQMTGDPVKYSFDGALDAYPDIWVGAAAPADPALVVSPGTLSFTATEGGAAPAAQEVQISNAGGGTLQDVSVNVSYASAQGWLDVAVSGGGDDQRLANQVDHAGLGVGEHQATVSVSCANADNSPRSYTVSLSVRQAPGPVPLPLRLNCGSNDYDVDGWVRDDDYVSGGDDWTNSSDVDTGGVADAAPALVYKSVRHFSPHQYDIPVPDGVYQLRLHFADAYTDRDMDYYAEGAPILQGFDIASEAGGVNRALVKRFDIEVVGGDGLQLEAVGVGDVFEAGLELLPLGSLDAGAADAAVADAARPDAGAGDAVALDTYALDSVALDTGALDATADGAAASPDAVVQVDDDAGGEGAEQGDGDVVLGAGCGCAGGVGARGSAALLALSLSLTLRRSRRRRAQPPARQVACRVARRTRG